MIKNVEVSQFSFPRKKKIKTLEINVEKTLCFYLFVLSSYLKFPEKGMIDLGADIFFSWEQFVF